MLWFGLGEFEIPSRQLSTRQMDALNATPDFSARRCLPSHRIASAKQHIPATLNRCRIGLAPVTCGGAWAISIVLGFGLSGVRQHPLGASTGSSTALPGVPQRLSFSGKAALASSSAPANSNQQPPTASSPNCSPSRTPHVSTRNTNKKPDKTTRPIVHSPFDPQHQTCRASTSPTTTAMRRYTPKASPCPRRPAQEQPLLGAYTMVVWW